MININKKALIITSRNLNKKGSGEFYKIISFIKSLQKIGYEVVILNINFKKSKINSFYNAKVIHRYPNLFKAFISFIRYFPTSIQRSLFASNFNLSNFENFDLILFSLLRTTPYFVNEIKKPLIIDLADLLSINFSRISKKSKGFIAKIKLLESFLLYFDEEKICKKNIALLVSRTELKVLKKRNLKAFHLIQASPLSLASSNKYLEIKYQPKNNLLFVGPNSYLPNHKALLWIDNYIGPRLNKNFSIDWIGRNDREFNYEYINSLGFVDDLAAEIVNAGINIVPIDIATGVQNKLIDCIFLGSNCFTLRKLIRPIGISLPNNIYSFDTLNELGEAVLNFANNLENLENKTKFALNYNFGLDSFKNRLEDYINEANSYYKNRGIR